MEECGVLEIFGYIENAEALWRVADSAEVDGLGLDWNESSSESEIIDAILEASERGTWLRLMKDECDDFRKTRMACQAAGLSYIHSRGVSGGEGYDTAAYWTRGQDKEFIAGLVHGIDVGIPLRDIQEAIHHGPEHVERLVAEFGIMTLEHLEKKIVLSPECVKDLAAAGNKI